MTDSNKYAAPPDEFPKKATSGSGSLTAYSVEARLAYIEPRMVASHLLDLRWRRIHYEKSPIGVPIGARYREAWLSAFGLFEYQAAQALRWWFLAVAESEFSCGCVETRLVEHKIEYSCSSTAIKPVAPIGGEDRSAIMPDWGKKVVPTPLPDDVGHVPHD